MLPVTDTERVRPVSVGAYAGRPDYGASGNVTEVQALIEADRVAYAARFQTLIGELRDPSRTGGSGPIVDVRTGITDVDDVTWVALVFGLVVTLPPDVLPGSEDSPVSAGGTAATRGALRLWAWSAGIEWAIRVRPIRVNGAATVLGTQTTQVLASGDPLDWRSVDVLLPDGIAAGDDLCIDVLYRPQTDFGGGVVGGSVYGWSVSEPDLTGVEGDPSMSIRSRARPSDYVDVALSAGTLTAIPVTAWDAVGSWATAYLQVEVLTTGQTVHVLPASTAQTVAPLAWQVTQSAGTWVSPTPIARNTVELLAANATNVRVWWLVVTGGY